MWAAGGFRPSVFESLGAGQKINHFPGSTELTHKDRLAANLRRKRDRFGPEYDIAPETFVLPEEYAAAYSRIREAGDLWISKPYAQSQGRGIYLVAIPFSQFMCLDNKCEPAAVRHELHSEQIRGQPAADQRPEV